MSRTRHPEDGSDSDPRWEGKEGRKILDRMAGEPRTVARMIGVADQPHNPRHSSAKPDWGTPPWIIAPAQDVLGGIHLDPASSKKANKIVNADFIFTKRQNGLKQRWEVTAGTSIWLNPPGGFIDSKGRLVIKGNRDVPNCSVTGACGLKPGHAHEDIQSSLKRWWRKLLIERQQSYFSHALFLSFSIEAMQTTQIECSASILDFPTIVFRHRVDYVDEYGEPVSGNTHASCLTYIPGRVNRTAYFLEKIQEFGQTIVPARRML